MAKQLTAQRFIFKIRSSRVRKARWNLTLPLDEARKTEEIIALADSQILRWIDELNGVENADDKVREIRQDIKEVRKEPCTLENRKKIRKLYEALDNLQFKPDYMCMIMDSEKDYRRACQGFKINGVKYARLLGTNGGVKNSTIVFVSERIVDEIRCRIENGRDTSVPLVPAKFEAYKALTCSASTPVRMPEGIIVVNDCETQFVDDVIYVDDDENGRPVMMPKNGETITLTESDGYGLMLPSLAMKWGQDIGVDYIPSGVNTRFAWEKGMVFTFDFREFAEKVAGSYIVKDAWGVDRDVREAELILTTSMVKLWDSYPSLEEYLKCSKMNGYTFGIPKVCPVELESERNLNYQFIQGYHLTDDDIEELIQPTIRDIHDAIHADWRKTVLFLKGSGLTDENIMSQDADVAKAVMIDQTMMDDPYVRYKVYNLIKNRIDEAKVGVVKVHGNYSIVCGDPYALCQSMFGLEVTGLLKPMEIYNRYWMDYESDKLVCFRAPMSSASNIRMVYLNRTDEAKHWYRFMNTCTLFSAFSNECAALNGMDM